MSMNKMDLMKKADEWTKKADKQSGEDRKKSLKNAAAYRWRANKLSTNLQKAKQVKNHVKKVVAQKIGIKASAPLSDIRPFVEANIELRVTDYNGRGDIVISKHAKGYDVHIELKDEKRSVWLPLAQVTTLAKAVQTLSAYITSNIGVGFYDEV